MEIYIRPLGGGVVMGKWKLAGLLGAAFLMSGNVMASNIDPMDQHRKAEQETYAAEAAKKMNLYMPQGKEQTFALGQELISAQEDISADVKSEIGRLAVEDAEARVINNIPINRARSELSSVAGDYEALKVRLSIREKMLPAWEKEKGNILSALSAYRKDAFIPSGMDRAYESSYHRTYKAEENVIRFYNGAFDPDRIRPYATEMEKAEGEFIPAARSHALKEAGLDSGLLSDANVSALADRYAKNRLLAMRDEIQVKLLAERLNVLRNKYSRAIETYEKLYAHEISRCNIPAGLLNTGKFDGASTLSKAAIVTGPVVSVDSGNISTGIPSNPNGLEAALVSPVSVSTNNMVLSGLVPSRSQEERDALKAALMKKMSSVSSEDLGRLSLRRAQFAGELSDIGYFDMESAKDQSASDTQARGVSDKRFKIDGEARLDYGFNHGKETIGDRGRARLRLWGDYNIDDNWHFIGMLENEKILTGRDDDNWMDFDRYYLSGNIGKVHADVGTFGSYLAEGNVYDSKFKGLRLTGDDPLKYMAEAGTIDDSGFVGAGEVEKDWGIYTLGAGLYRFDLDYAPSRTIYMANVRRPWGAYNLGLMGLLGSDSTHSSQKGFVASISKGEERTWEKGNRYYFLKYYYQPYTTYVSHTMEGMADYMHGFKGIGAGFHYTPKENWLFQLEYYNLEDIENGGRNHTLWVALNYYFSNYIAY